MKISHWIVALVLFTICRGANADNLVQLLSSQTHSRFIFRIDESVSVEWKNSEKGFEIYLKGLGIADLGAPVGEEEKWKTQFEGLGDSRVDSLEFKEVAGGIKIFGKWKFPVGKF